MKRAVLLFVGIIASSIIIAQSSDYFNYQAVIRDASGNVKANIDVSILIEILQGSVDGTTVFSETHVTTTNSFGVVNLVIGSVNSVDFSTINFANGPFFLRVSIDGMVMGTSQLISVPFALYAKYAGNYAETDPLFAAHPASGISSTDLTNWNSAYNWGNHADAGYLKSFAETDPVFAASTASGISATHFANWNTAYGWGNHADAGYLKSFTETDPVFMASTASGITATHFANWNTAYGWGNHADAGYLKSFTETDPVFLASTASGITATDFANWNTAYGWGNHATAGYLTSYTETDPVFIAHPSFGITSGNITNWNTAYGWGNHADAGYLKSYAETDPIFTASQAYSITATHLSNWNTAYGWGNHATAGYLTSYTETDPVFIAHPSFGITSGNIANWNTAYGWGNHATAGYLTSFTETDPVWIAASSNYYTKTNLQTGGQSLIHFNNLTNTPTTIAGYGITDAMTTSHAANGITLTNITNWDAAFSWGNHAGLYRPIGYVPAWSEITNNPFSFTTLLNNQLLKYNTTSSKWENWTPNYLTDENQALSLSTNQLSISGAGGNTVTFTNWDNNKNDDVTITTPVSGDIVYYNGTSWTALPKGTTGQVLTMNASGFPEWQYTYTAPTAQTQAATFSLPSAILNGVVNPNKLQTTVTFQYGTTISYGSTITAAQSPLNGSTNTNVSASVSGLVAGTTYHFRVKAENSFGITYGDDMTFTLLGTGISWEGGLIFYLDATGLHGLVAASSDQVSADWGCYPSVISGADGTAVGTGNQNTTDIVTGCTTVGIAAEICYNLSLNGYADWFLPSKDELGLMYTNLYLAGKGSFSATIYWSSSEYNINYSYRLNFSGGVSGTSLKNSIQSVRAARAF